ncbi:MAG: hypothetical protein Q7T97_01040 [Burkholderiaceae bacterium]|nr:hypothetical protein [Burkholderiaceae bacterium]
MDKAAGIQALPGLFMQGGTAVFFVVTTSPGIPFRSDAAREVALMGRVIFDVLANRITVVVPGGARATAYLLRGDPVACAKSLLRELYQTGRIRPVV